MKLKSKHVLLTTAALFAAGLIATGIAQQLQVTEGNVVTEQLAPETGSAIAIQCRNIAQPTPKEVTLTWQVGDEPANKWIFSGEGRDRDGLMSATRESGAQRRTLNGNREPRGINLRTVETIRDSRSQRISNRQIPGVPTISSHPCFQRPGQQKRWPGSLPFTRNLG